MNIEFKEDISEYLKELVEKEHEKYENFHEVACKYKPFYFLAKEDSTVLGIISGYTCYAEVYIDDIVVFEVYRKMGIGKALLQAVQTQFANGTFQNINLVTNEFQAPEFYKKCGFLLEFVRINKQNPLLSKYFFVKFFDKETAD